MRERLLLADQEEFFVALKEEGGAHTLLRGAENTAEGFEVDRANSSSSTSLIFALPAKIPSFFVKEIIDQSNTIYKGDVFMINPSLMIGIIIWLH